MKTLGQFGLSEYVELTNQQKKKIIGGVYNPPSCDGDEFTCGWPGCYGQCGCQFYVGQPVMNYYCL